MIHATARVVERGEPCPPPEQRVLLDLPYETARVLRDALSHVAYTMSAFDDVRLALAEAGITLLNSRDDVGGRFIGHLDTR